MKVTQARGGAIVSDYGSLKKLMEERRLSVKEVAKRSELSYHQVLRISNGHNTRKKFYDKVMEAIDSKAKVETVVEEVNVPDLSVPAPVIIPEKEWKEMQKPLPSVTTEDILIGAFKQFLSTLEVTIRDQVKESIVEFLSQPQQKAMLPVAPIVQPVYSPPLPEGEVVNKVAALSAGLPVSMPKQPGWSINYTRRFLKELDKTGGIKNLAVNQIKRFSEQGEVFSYIGFKKMYVSNAMGLASGADHEFRINRRWRILLKKSNEEKSYTMMRVAHHDEIE